MVEPPKCKCGAHLGLYFRDDRWICGDCMCNKIAELHVIVNKLPKCWRLEEDGKLVQDVPVLPGMDAWLAEPDVHCIMVSTIDERGNCETHFHGFRHSLVHAICLFDSREAAEARADLDDMGDGQAATEKADVT